MTLEIGGRTITVPSTLLEYEIQNKDKEPHIEVPVQVNEQKSSPKVDQPLEENAPHSDQKKKKRRRRRRRRRKNTQSQSSNE